MLSTDHGSVRSSEDEAEDECEDECEDGNEDEDGYEHEDRQNVVSYILTVGL